MSEFIDMKKTTLKQLDEVVKAGPQEGPTMIANILVAVVYALLTIAAAIYYHE